MRIVISGASGLVGTALRAHLMQQGHDVSILIRGQSSEKNAIPWNPYAGPEQEVCDPRRLNGAEAFIHLSGESVAAGRWTPAQKRRLRDSRVLTTRNLVRAISEMKPAPKAFLCASAIGCYGERGDQVLTEESAAGKGFLADLCRQWEEEAQGAARAGVRVANLRFGLVLSRNGGPLAKMLSAFRLGLGGRLASGRQYMSWIAIDDAIRAIHHIVMTEGLRGPVNVVAPEPVTNSAFTTTLGAVLHRPTIFPVPKMALKILLGEMADALTASSRVTPAKLTAAGFEFRYPNLRQALENLLIG